MFYNGLTYLFAATANNARIKFLKQYSMYPDYNCLIKILEQGLQTAKNLADLRKPKQPLFKTEDGKDIYEKQTFWYIGDAYNICQTQCLHVDDEDFSKTKTFSTEEAAKEYALYNKPCLSLNEIVHTKEQYGYLGDCLCEKLKELIKDKLQ